MNPLAPSHAALLIPASDPTRTLEQIAAALLPQGYVPMTGPPPSWHRPHQLECVGVATSQLPDASLTMAVTDAVENIFHVASWLSAACPDTPLIAWRRFMGQPGVTKFYLAGPRWRDGDDDDLELAWHLPSTPPVDSFDPETHGLPRDTAGAERILRDTAPGLTPGNTLRWWALRTSVLHDL